MKNIHGSIFLSFFRFADSSVVHRVRYLCTSNELTVSRLSTALESSEI